MSVNFILIPTALENSKKNATTRSQKNNQSKSPFIHSHIVIDFLLSGNSFTHKPCLQGNAADESLNSLAMNAGGAAW